MLVSAEELQKAATIDPEVVEGLKAMNYNPSDEPLSLEQLREFMAMMESESKEPLPSGLKESYCDIPMRDGFLSKIKIIKPEQKAAGPLVVLFFGGSFVSGSLEQLVGIGRILVQLYDATIVCPNYRLAPEHKFPISQYDGWDTMEWIAKNATSDLLHADPQKGFIIGGVSAGGGLSATLTRVFQDMPLTHSITGQWLCIPSLIGPPENVPPKYKSVHVSQDQCGEAPFLTKKALAENIRHTQADTSSPLRYPILAKSPMSGQPRTHFQVGGLDPLRDDALIYDELLKEAGVETRLDLYYGCPHGFFSFPPFKGTKLYARANIDTLVGFGWLLGQNTSRDAVADLVNLREN